MDNTGDGGRAFPMVDEFCPTKGIRSHGGMSLRDYFAAHAPWPPRWGFFIPEVGKKPDEARAAQLWQSKLDMLTAIQWPWVWADAMLAERSKMLRGVHNADTR